MVGAGSALQIGVANDAIESLYQTPSNAIELGGEFLLLLDGFVDLGLAVNMGDQVVVRFAELQE